LVSVCRFATRLNLGMAELVANCPRCGAKHITFDVRAVNLSRIQYGWHHTYEAFAICRHCAKSTTFVLDENAQHHDINLFQKTSPLKIVESLNGYFSIRGFVGLKDLAAATPPDHVPEPIANVFMEGATCLSVECWNAAGAMFRASIDLATRPLLPVEETHGLNNKTRRDLGLRLRWLFESGRLPNDLHELSNCIREDGNDGAHQGSLKKEDAEDLLDFARALLERLFTEPRRLEIAKERREKRRTNRE
jgi:Domain of unknown function (DUF4145)